VRRRAGSNSAVEIVHTDLPTNDFSALFDAVLTDPSSYLVRQNNVFPAAISRSYFEPLLPPGTVHLAWNTWSMQWMSRPSGPAPDHVLAGMSEIDDVRATVASIQAQDWETFLALRANELAPGGRMLTAFTARTEQETGWEWLLGELWGAVLDLTSDRELDGSEAIRMTIPIGLRLLEEVQRPFQSGRFAGLVAERIELTQAADPFWPKYERTGDRASFAKRHAETTRAWAGP
jgi:hypothetical protein